MLANWKWTWNFFGTSGGSKTLNLGPLRAHSDSDAHVELGNWVRFRVTSHTSVVGIWTPWEESAVIYATP